jgi:hypothetical protein
MISLVILLYNEDIVIAELHAASVAALRRG